ncbi:5506_t:CDS:2 [Diversispora eburnea]|uniref:5506_t:CDS:1 n=1 Tax=Diversispora eburnea TaxID=1213867 RepID=A0A9N9C616_9GLOM|nr:5506_t:CDS:2 [Diversispora eburnea]
MSASNEKKKKSVFKIPKFLKNIKKKKEPEVPNPSVPEISNPPETFDSPEMLSPSVLNPPETVDSLHNYETRPGQAQKFLADDSALEFDDEAGLNLISFFDNLDRGTFDEHKDSWVLIYKQEVKKYGSEYTSKELWDLENEMPGAIYLPVDTKRREDLVKVAPARTVNARHNEDEHMVRIRVRNLNTNKIVTIDYNFRDPVENNKLYKSVIDSGAPETTLPYYVRSTLGRQGWNPTSKIARGYGAPSRVFIATASFEMAIGDNNNWSKWVTIDTLRVWQRDPGPHIDSSLVGCDVLDHFFFVHQPNQGYKFLRATDEISLINFINNLP